MKAIVLKQFGGTEHFALEEVPTPEAGGNLVLIRIKAIAFNPIDYQMRRGLGEAKLLQSPILGREFAGVVADPGGSSFNKGDAVYAYSGSLGSNGTYAEYISLPSGLLAPMPPNLDFTVAAAVPMVSLTALQCLGRMQAGGEETVFIAGGAGGVGSVLIQLLKLNGAKNIVTTAGSEESRQSLLALGLPDSAIIDYRTQDLYGRVLDANGGRPFDHCVDIVGGAMSELCSRLLAVFGSYYDIAFLGTNAAREALFDKAATIHNVANYAYAAGEDPESYNVYSGMLRYLSGLLQSGKLQPPSVLNLGSFSVATVAEAHRMMEENRTNGRKLVMEVGA